MALINCRECGHCVSDKAAACPNCGAPVELSLTQKEQTVLANISPTPTPPAIEQEDNTEEKKSSGALIIAIGLIVVIIIIAIAIIGGSYSSRKSRSSYVADSLHRVEQERIERERAKWQDADSIRKYINGTVWTYTETLVDGDGYWYKLEFKNNKVYYYEVSPSKGSWGRPSVSSYKIEDKRYINTGEKYTCISWWVGGSYISREQILNISSLTNPENINTEETPRAEMQFVNNILGKKDYNGVKVKNRDENPWH